MDRTVQDRPPLRLLKLAPVLLGALVLVIAAHLFEPQYFSRTAKAFIKSLHAPGFAVVSASLAFVLQRHGLWLKSYIYAAAGALAAGVLSELAQLSGPRHAELDDLLKDIVGICAGLGLIATFDFRIRRSIGPVGTGLLLLITGIVVTASLRESVSIVYALVSRNAAVPVLMSFDQSWEHRLYQEAGRPTVTIVNSPPDWPADGGRSVLLTTATGRYRTFLHLRPYPDWRNFDEVSFVAASADENSYEVTLTIRDIRPTADSPRNSFNGRITVTPDPRRFSFRLKDIAAAADARPFDFAHVDIVILSLARHEGSGSILLDDFRLL